jgi:hypothetical protein
MIQFTTPRKADPYDVMGEGVPVAHLDSVIVVRHPEVTAA